MRVPTEESYVYVDATNGDELAVLARVAYDRHREVYEDTDTTPNTLVLDDECHPTGSTQCGSVLNECPIGAQGSCPSECINPSRSANADLIYDSMDVFYTYFNSRHGRDSWNNDGASACHRLRVFYANTSSGTCGATWEPTLDRVSVDTHMHCSDVIVHEFTHGIDEAARPSSPLYSAADDTQAAALSEGIPDIFAELAKKYDTGSTDWIHTLDCGTPSPECRRLSDFANPPSFSYSACGPGPDTFSDLCRSEYSDLNIPGKAAYLGGRDPSEGAATHYQITTTGIGEAPFGANLYYCFNSVFAGSENFTGYADCLISRSCSTQSSNECQQVTNAHDAVSIWRPFRGAFTGSTEVAVTRQNNVTVCQGCLPTGSRRYAFYPGSGGTAVKYRRRDCAMTSSSCNWSTEQSLGVSMTASPATANQTTGMFNPTIVWVCGPVSDGGSPGSPVQCRRILGDFSIATGPNPPGSRTDTRVSLAWHAGYLYIFKRVAGTGNQSIVWNRFDPGTGTWSAQSTAPFSSPSAPTAISDGSATNGLWVAYRRNSDNRIVYRALTDPATNTWSVERVAGRSDETPTTTTAVAGAMFKSRLHIAVADASGNVRYMSCAQPCTAQSNWTRWVMQDYLALGTVSLSNIDGILARWQGDPVEGNLQWNFKVSE